MSIELAMAVYDSLEGAERAYGKARRAGSDAAWLMEIAFVEMHHNGRVTMRGTFGDRYASVDEIGDVGVSAMGAGAFTGAVVGSIFGPAGFTAGMVVGGMAGGRKAAQDAPLAGGELIEELRGSLKQGTSALVLLAESEHVDEMVEMLATDPDHLLRRELTDAQVEMLKQSIADVPVAEPGEFS